MLITKQVFHLGKDLTLKTFVTYNAGKTWAYLRFKNKQNSPCKSPKINFRSIEILNEGEILVGMEDNKHLHVSLDYGMNWQILKLGTGEHQILKLITVTGSSYTLAMVGKKSDSGFHISILNFAEIFSK
ncbi:hypothetical protein RF11_14657 [Thelohanellus kitauei]|uniref:Sortilin N-terminal domain-containing protein n=1 Tax=Thelohanellus kitauei TaxID=669202 RepID=A0A0C2MQU6_THEKT|nr:hypothetical protein RF11_14657 [Thelohanellus kitauei]